MQFIMSNLEKLFIRLLNLDRYLPIQLDITNACNLRCIHCYHPHHSNENTLSIEQWFQIIDQYDLLINRLSYKPLLILCGGEPLISSNLHPILSYVMTKQTKYQVIILTNGTIVQKFQLPKGMSASQVSFQISLDGPNSAAHDRVRGKGSFEKTRRGVARLINAGFTVELQSVLSLQSMPFIYELFNTAKEWGVSSLKFTRLISNGQGKALVSDGIDLPLTANELKIAYENIIQSAALTNVSTSTDVPLMHLLHPSLGGHGRFFESVVIDYTGKYLASSRSRIVLGDALSDGIESIFLKHPLLRDLRKGKVKVCRDCRFNRQCGGDRNAAFAASGDYLGADPGCWLYSTKQQICN